MSELQVLLVETKSGRTVMSPASLAHEPEFWTIDCALFHIAEPLIREAGRSASLSGIVAALHVPGFQLPASKMLCGVRPSDYIGSYAYRKREVDRIVILPDERRIDLRWVPLASPSRWLSPPNQVSRAYRELSSMFGGILPGSVGPMLVGVRDIDVSPISEQVAVSAFGLLFLLPGTPVANYMQEFFERAEGIDSQRFARALFFVSHVIQACCQSDGDVSDAVTLVRKVSRNLERFFRIEELDETADVVGLTDMVANTKWTVFDPTVWQRHGGFSFA